MARTVDPAGYLQSRGFEVIRQGRHMSARLHGDEIYRLTQKEDGRFLWCDLFGNSGGDTIDLVMDVENVDFVEAVRRLIGDASSSWRPVEVKLPPRQPPVLPPQEPEHQEAGRRYLRCRGISRETILYAEQSGVLRYSAGGVLFVGRDQAGVPQNITRRAIDPDDAVQKRDLRGSDKRYPPVLPGDPAEVWIVEGGVDGLAVHDLARREGRNPPTVIVSGGARVHSFLNRPEVQAMLKQALSITVALDREAKAETQAKTNAAHDKQIKIIREVTGRDANRWFPPEGVKDLAELNQKFAEVENRRGFRMGM
ncbi:MAG: hypothetical protein K6346_07295 [Halothiobacillaceae bacterium]